MSIELDKPPPDETRTPWAQWFFKVWSKINELAANVKQDLIDGLAIPTATVSATDKVLIQDTDDNDELKTVTAQSIADLTTSSWPRFSSYKAANQTGINTNNSYVKVVPDTTSVNVSSFFNTATSIATIPTGQSGAYVFGSVPQSAATNILSNAYAMTLYRNGVAFLEILPIRSYSAGTAFFGSGNSGPVTCTAGETYELYIYGAGNNSASNYQLVGSSFVPLFYGYRIA